MTDTDLIATSAPAGSESGDNSQASSSASNGAVATSTKRAETRRGAGLSGMVLTELRTLAGELGIKGTSGMRKGDLIAAIKERQGAARRLHPHRVNSLSTTHPLRALVPRALAPHAPKPPQPKQLRQPSRLLPRPRLRVRNPPRIPIRAHPVADVSVVAPLVVQVHPTRAN